ncbi:MAG: RNA methyltransferase [Bacteroidales bacterium]|nr:RNA methyltransferase [Bacteroidales bacterium]MBN2758153.1 RNA methyltransferase [Bacteroidales bacterium]
MISKAQIKFINSLKLKKFRDENALFVAEGYKIVNDLVNSSLKIKTVYYTHEYFNVFNAKEDFELIEVSQSDLDKVSFLKNSSKVIALIEIPSLFVDFELITNEISIALDTIQDPGNLGTIIRTADWFGVKNIYCSKDCVDVFNPKVVQATMGAIGKVNVHYLDLKELFSKLIDNQDFKIHGSFLDGESVYKADLKNKGIILMGNEGNGISEELEKFISKRLFIPKFYTEEIGSESLNVSIATSIILSEFKRRTVI